MTSCLRFEGGFWSCSDSDHLVFWSVVCLLHLRICVRNGDWRIVTWSWGGVLTNLVLASPWTTRNGQNDSTASGKLVVNLYCSFSALIYITCFFCDRTDCWVGQSFVYFMLFEIALFSYLCVSLRFLVVSRCWILFQFNSDNLIWLLKVLRKAIMYNEMTVSFKCFIQIGQCTLLWV